MSKITEHYIRARHTSNLKSVERTTHSASDIIAAAGMAGQSSPDALALWNVVYGGKSGQKHALVDGLAHRLTDYMAHHRLKGDPHKIARAVIAYHLHAVCEPCSGTGYQMMPDRPIRGDDLCPECDGVGKPRPPEDAAFAWLHRYVAGLIGQAGGRIMAKLSDEMEL